MANQDFDPTGMTLQQLQQSGANISQDAPQPPSPPPQDNFDPTGMSLADVQQQGHDVQATPQTNDDFTGMSLSDLQQQGHSVKAEGPAGTFLREAANAAIPTIASVGPMMVGAEAGAAIGSFGGPAAPVTVPVGALIGAGVAGIATSGVVSAAQEKVKNMLGLDDSEQRAVNARVNPTSATIGQLAPMAVTFKVGNLADSLAQRLVTGAGMGGVNAAQQYVEKGTIDPKEAAINAAAGFALNKPRPWAAPMAEAGQRFGAKLFRNDPQVFPPGRPDMDSDTKEADLHTVSPIRSATSNTRGIAMEQAAPDPAPDPTTLGDAKVQSSTPKSGDGGSDGRWAKEPPVGTSDTLTISDGTRGLADDQTILSALPGQPSADEVMAAHNAPGEIENPAPPQGNPVPPLERPMFDSRAPFEDQLKQLQDYRKAVMGQQDEATIPPAAQPAEFTPPVNGQLPPVGEQHAIEMNQVTSDAAKRAVAAATERSNGQTPKAQEAIATSKRAGKLKLPTPPETTPPSVIASHLQALRDAQAGKPTPFDAEPAKTAPKQTAQKTVELLKANGQDKLAARLAQMPEGAAKDQEAARLAAAAGSNVTGKVPGTLKNVRVRNPEKLADLNVVGYTNPRTGRPVRAKDFAQKYVSEAVHDVNGRVHANPDLAPPEGTETADAVQARAKAILDDAVAKAKEKAEEMKVQADQMKEAAAAAKPGPEKKSALARATAMRVAANRIGSGELPVDIYKMSGLDKPAEWRLQRHAKDFLNDKFPTDTGVPPHEKFLADEALIRQGGEAYRTFVENNRAEAEAANKPEGKSDISTAEGVAALTRPAEAKPSELAEAAGEEPFEETLAERSKREGIEDRVLDKLRSMGHNRIADQLEAMPLSDARVNNFKQLEDKLLKGKQASPSPRPQAMAKPRKPLTMGQTEAIIKKIDEQASAVQEFVKEANGEGVKTPPNAPPKAAEAVKKSVAIAARKGLIEQLNYLWNGGEHGRTMQDIIRERGGITAQILSKASRIMNGFTPLVNKLSPAEQETFMKAMDTGAETTKELQPIADWWKSAAADVAQRVNELPDHEKQEWVKNYFPHYFTDSKAADAFVDKWYEEKGSPHEGSTASLQHRTFPTIQEGLDAGLKLATTNPLQVMGRYLGSMHTYVAQQEIINAAKDAGIVQAIDKQSVGASGNPESRVVPDGWVALRGRAQYGEPLYAPADAAQIYNNYISKGFGEISPQHGRTAEVLQRASNAVTGLELSFNGYHFFTIGKEGIINEFARAMSQAMGGDFGKAVTSLGKAATAPVSLARTGATVKQVAMGEVEGDPRMNEIISLGTRAGARWEGMMHDPTYSFSPMHGYFTAWRRGSLGMELADVPRRVKEAGTEGKLAQGVQVGKEIFSAVGRTMQTVAEPLFQHYIPNMKNGAVYENLGAWLDAHPDATESEKLHGAQQIIDSVDNRFGEMIHDNIFWNKATKQSAMIMMRAYSWFLGTAREIGGGAVSAFQNPERINISHPQHDPRAAYALTMPVVVALTSMVYQFLKTGEAPGDLRDLFVPKTGGQAGIGGPERAALPGYEKDVYGWMHNPTQEAVNKIATAPRLVWDILSNQDYKGAPIANPNAPLTTRMLQYTGHVVDAMNPISVRNIYRGSPRGSNITLPERVTAIREAPTYLENPARISNAVFKNNQKIWKMKVRQDVKAENRFR